VSQVVQFQAGLKTDLVLKPLDLKGGEGIVRLRRKEKNYGKIIMRATESGKKMIMAQEFLQAPEVKGDKRILVLDGEILTAYEKHFKKGEFRANISLGGTIHPTELSREEKALVKALKPYLLREGLHLTGIDVMMGKLIEINVTCPAGIMEAKLLYPRSELVEAWADLLEKKVREKKTGNISHHWARTPYK